MGTENCAACHKTPVLGIHLEEYGFGPGGELVVKTEGAGNIPKRLNALIADYGPPYYAVLTRTEGRRSARWPAASTTRSCAAARARGT